MKHLKTYENSDFDKRLLQRKDREKFKVGDYAIMLASNNKKFKILEVRYNTLLIDYDGHPMEFLMKGFIPEFDFDTNKYNI